MPGLIPRNRSASSAVAPMVRITGPDVPPPFLAIIQRALSANVDARFPSTREMARQIGTTLKKVQLRKDLHTVLARSVIDARSGMGLGVRTGDPSSARLIAEAAFRAIGS